VNGSEIEGLCAGVRARQFEEHSDWTNVEFRRKVVATRLILPDYIVGHFVPPNACAQCGRSAGCFTLLFPQLNWHADAVELIYPLRCSCGGSGCVPIRLPTLLFGYILASVAFVDAQKRRRPRATMTISLCRSDILVDIFRKFDRLMENPSSAAFQSTALPANERNALTNNDASEANRIKFGLSKTEWQKFLRRLGLNQPGNPDDPGRHGG